MTLHPQLKMVVLLHFGEPAPGGRAQTAGGCLHVGFLCVPVVKRGAKLADLADGVVTRLNMPIPFCVIASKPVTDCDVVASPSGKSRLHLRGVSVMVANRYDDAHWKVELRLKMTKR